MKKTKNEHSTISPKGVILFYENLWNTGQINIEGPAFKRMVSLKRKLRNRILKSI